MNTKTHDLHALKQRLLIPDVWIRLGLPGAPRRLCRSPFREDRCPSFSIYHDGRSWQDFATGEKGDVIDFIAVALQISMKEAISLALSFASNSPPPPLANTRLRVEKQGEIHMPPLHEGSCSEIQAVASSRNICYEAVKYSHANLRTLLFGNVCNCPSWILSDDARIVAEARRLDGSVFPQSGADVPPRKAHTIRGGRKSWPVGAAVLERNTSYRAIALVEGGPDYLAVVHFCVLQSIMDVLPVAMLGRGSGNNIHPRALKLMAGRHVRIYPHLDADGGGRRSADQWANQLSQHGCTVEFFSFENLIKRDGMTVKDLNDCTCLRPDQEAQLSNLLP